MAELALPDGPAQLLEAVRHPIAQYLGGEHEMHLGGGTALAARWQHRHSTDVDLFVGHEAYQRLRKDGRRFCADLERRNPEACTVAVNPQHALIHLWDGGEISISSSPPCTSHPVSGDTVRGTGVPLETTAEILAKKLGYRMIGNAKLVPRDLYDIASARRYAPAELQQAFSTLEDEQLLDIARELRSLGPRWMQDHKQPLIGATNEKDAATAAYIARKLILKHVPSTARDWRASDTWGR